MSWLSDIANIVGSIGGVVGSVSGGGGGSTAQASTDVAVNPTINLATITDLSPVQDLVNQMAGQNTDLASAIVVSQALENKQRDKADKTTQAIMILTAVGGLLLFTGKL